MAVSQDMQEELIEKISLLKLEHADMSRFFVPKKGTAL